MDCSSDPVRELVLASLEDIVVADLPDALISSSSDAELIVVAWLCPLLDGGASEGRREEALGFVEVALSSALPVVAGLTSTSLEVEEPSIPDIAACVEDLIGPTESLELFEFPPSGPECELVAD